MKELKKSKWSIDSVPNSILKMGSHKGPIVTPPNCEGFQNSQKCANLLKVWFIACLRWRTGIKKIIERWDQFKVKRLTLFHRYDVHRILWVMCACACARLFICLHNVTFIMYFRFGYIFFLILNFLYVWFIFFLRFS